MKALSIRQPWVEAILSGGKRVENRDWKGCAFRGEFLIHASKSGTRSEHEEACDAIARMGITWVVPAFDSLTRGALVGIATVAGVLHQDSKTLDPYWTGGFALVLERVRPLKRSVPYKGQLGFFEVPEHVWIDAAPEPGALCPPLFYDRSGDPWVVSVSKSTVDLTHQRRESLWSRIGLNSQGKVEASSQSAPPEVVSHVFRLWKHGEAARG